MTWPLTRRAVASLLLAGLAARGARAADLSGITLVVGDQKGGSRALMEAAGALADVPTGSNGTSSRRHRRCWRR